jgi:bacterioferritin-associated ferredoxin
MYVCLCKGLTEADVRCAARSGCVAPESLIARLGLEDDDCCGRCAREIDAIVVLAVAEVTAMTLHQPA